MKNNKNKLIFFNSIMLDNPNRGCQALTYGSFIFISDYLKTDDFEVISPAYFIRRPRKDVVFEIPVKNTVFKAIRRYYWWPTVVFGVVLSKLFGKTIPIGKFGRDFNKTKYTFSIAGGDGFADIYSFRTFKEVSRFTYLAAIARKKIVLLPQTIGPFYEKRTQKMANAILNNASQIYVRDLSYADSLDAMGLKYTLTHDVSFFMQPQKVAIEIPNNAVGINISGLLYFNNFQKLAGRSECYKDLIKKIIYKFQRSNTPIVLIPHTYNYNNMTDFDDDLSAIRKLYLEMENKSNVFIIDGDYSAPELKYIISQCDFFIGSRMHANFAAIYTHIPVFGLAYSYKFKGAFDAYGLHKHYANIIDLEKKEIPALLAKIETSYQEKEQTKKFLLNI
ncbi:MAG: polysaccharide pyruvyl transferase family protein [Prevotella sp.]|jgi:polysaccharide pyruvyl transferase WcaK-like protein|nr:polysaccharide pyruvyl transferase family protein [Prevotella sp.]